MRTNPIQRIIAQPLANWVAIVATAILLASLCTSQAAGGKNSGTTTKDQTITAKLTLDLTHPSGLPNRVVGDGKGTYIHGSDLVSVQIGAEHSMTVFTSQFNKPPKRHFHLNPALFTPENGYFPEIAFDSVCNPTGLIGNGAKPVFSSSQIFRSIFQIFGENHDDTPSGTIRLVNARVVMKDDMDRSWTVYFGKQQPYLGLEHPCGSWMIVKREANTTAGKGLWTFSTEAQNGLHVGYLYYIEGSPATEVFAGVVDFPMSGSFESLISNP